MKKNRSAAPSVIDPPPPGAAPSKTSPSPSGLEWMAQLTEEGRQAHAEYAAREDRLEALRREDKCAPYVERARGPVEIARRVLPLLEKYQAESAETRALATDMGLDIGPHSVVAKADASGALRNIREAIQTFDNLAAGRVAPNTDLDAMLAEMLLKVKGAAARLPAYQQHATALVARMQEVNATRGNRPLAEGPPVQHPELRAGADPPRQADMRYDVHDFGKEG